MDEPSDLEKQILVERHLISRELSGAIDGRQVSIQSFYGEEHGDALNYRFSGTVDGDTMAGSLDMGEYLKATWSASRRERSSRR